MPKPHAESLGVRVNSSLPQNRVSSSSEDAPAVSASPTRFPTLEKWVNRIAVLLFVSLCAIFGVVLVIVPWTPKWTDNYMLISYPGVRDFLENGFVRGMCTGLGALDIWIGFWEASHYHEKEFRH